MDGKEENKKNERKERENIKEVEIIGKDLENIENIRETENIEKDSQNNILMNGKEENKKNENINEQENKEKDSENIKKINESKNIGKETKNKETINEQENIEKDSENKENVNETENIIEQENKEKINETNSDENGDKINLKDSDLENKKNDIQEKNLKNEPKLENNELIPEFPKRQKISDQKSFKVAQHYNKIPSISRNLRNDSKIINLRNVNNFIKSILYNIFVKKNDNVLDLGCGKGGDIFKYLKCGIKFLYGVDIAENSILEYKNRLKKVKFPFDAKLEVLDICNQEIISNKKFEIISLQFSIHYSFESKEKFELLFKSIKNNSKKNTHILITTIDQSLILNEYNNKLITNKKCEYCQKKEMCFGNSLFHIKFGNISQNLIFGNSYKFTLKEALEDCEEYLVRFGYLVDEFEKNDFELIENKSFKSFLEENSRKFENLKRKMIKNEITKEEEEIMGIYRILVFKKL